MSGLPLAALALLTPVAGSVAADAPADRRPDVLFVAVDDLNDWVGCLGGHPRSVTPNFDRLAARGVLFTNAHTASPSCNPSRAALLSGRRPGTSGIYFNSQPAANGLAGVVTLPEHFRANGYRVLGGGKIFHGGPGPGTGSPVTPERFWDDYFSAGKFPAPPGGNVNGLNKGHFDWGPVDVPDAALGDTRLVTWAADELTGSNGDDARPRFLAAGLYRPHLPWYVPAKYFADVPARPELPAYLADDLADVPPAGVKLARPQGDHAAVLKSDQWHAAVRGYLASIRYADTQLGRLIDALDAGGAADNTIVVLWGDHGWHLGEKDHWRKFTLWERATRVPYLIVAPGVTGPGGRCDAPVDLMSVYPTLCDLCGLDRPDHVEGDVLTTLLRDPSAAWDGVAVTTYGPGRHAVRDDRWRLIRYAGSGEGGTAELYDHAADPHEWTNVSDRPEHADRIATLAALLPENDAEPLPHAKKNRKRKRGAGK